MQGSVRHDAPPQTRRPFGAGPAELLYRQDGAAAQPRAAATGPRALRQRHGTAANGACGLSCARLMRMPRSSAIDAAAARRVSGVIAVVTGKELAAVITPWVGVLSHMKGLKSAPQRAIAIDHVCWQGEAVAAVVATSRAVAEDAAEMVAVEYEELEAVTDMRTALDPTNPSDSCFARRQPRLRAKPRCRYGRPGVRRFRRGGGSGIRLRPSHRRNAGARAVVADWNAAEARLTIYQGTQAPHMVQNIAALHLGLREDAGPGGLQGCRRFLRHQGPRLRR